MKKNDGDHRRVSRVEQEIQKTIAQFLISGFRYPLKGLVTVSRVVMPGDLRTAKVYVSVLGSDEDRETTIETLQEQAYDVQNFIGKELRMRFCPKLTFYKDDTTEHVMKIDRILHELDQNKANSKINSQTKSNLELVQDDADESEE